MLLAPSTCPFVWGCATTAQSTLIWLSSQNLRNFFPVNCVSLSVIMEFGTLKRWMMSVKNLTASSDLIFAIGVGGPYRQIYTTNISPKRRKIYIYTHIYMCN
jgi:hypothetical protein